MPGDTLTPKQAAKRFGELKDRFGVYIRFDDSMTGGFWHPQIIEGELTGYTLYASPTPNKAGRPKTDKKERKKGR